MMINGRLIKTVSESKKITGNVMLDKRALKTELFTLFLCSKYSFNIDITNKKGDLLKIIIV